MINSGWKLKPVTPPAVEPVTLARAKRHMRVVISDEDEDITSMIKAARMAAEEYTRRAFVYQVWDAAYPCFPTYGIRLPKPPLISLISVNYTDDDDVYQLLPSDQYRVDSFAEPGVILRPNGVRWPIITQAGPRVVIRFAAGYPQGAGSPGDDAENVPDPIKAAILLHVGEMYENRDVAAEMPMACESLLHPYRVYGWGDA